MKIARFLLDGSLAYGAVDGGEIAVLRGDPFAVSGEGLVAGSNKIVGLEGVRLLSPCVPGKVLGVGLNHPEIARRLERPLPAVPRLFIKPSSSVQDPDGPIVLPAGSTRVVHEGELAVVIGKPCRNVTASQALDHVLGVTCTNDVSDLTHANDDAGNLTRVKCRDTFAPLGPWIVTGLALRDLEIEVRVNGQVRQQGATASFVFPVEEVVAFASTVMTLWPGDVIACGTPPWPQPLHPGDVVEVEIQGVGVLRNPVVGSELPASPELRNWRTL